MLPHPTRVKEFKALIESHLPEFSLEQMRFYQRYPHLLRAPLQYLGRELIDCVRPDLSIVWKEIVVGGMTNAQLAEELSRLKIQFDEVMLMNTPEILQPHRAKLAHVSMQDLGFTGEPTMVAALKRMRDVGMTYHAAVGPYLRLAYCEQKIGESFVHVAMDPLPCEFGMPGAWMMDHFDDNGHMTPILTLMADSEGRSSDSAEPDMAPRELVGIIEEMELIS